MESITQKFVQSDGMIQHQLAPDSHAVTHTHCSTPICSAIFCGSTYFKAEYSGECTERRLGWGGMPYAGKAFLPVVDHSIA